VDTNTNHVYGYRVINPNNPIVLKDMSTPRRGEFFVRLSREKFEVGVSASGPFGQGGGK
jgi:hypothetical protein